MSHWAANEPVSWSFVHLARPRQTSNLKVCLFLFEKSCWALLASCPSRALGPMIVPLPEYRAQGGSSRERQEQPPVALLDRKGSLFLKREALSRAAGGLDC